MEYSPSSGSNRLILDGYSTCTDTTHPYITDASAGNINQGTANHLLDSVGVSLLLTFVQFFGVLPSGTWFSSRIQHWTKWLSATWQLDLIIATATLVAGQFTVITVK